MQTIQDFANSKNLSINVINSWIYRHGLPVIKIGKRNYIDESDYDAWRNSLKRVVGNTQAIEIPEPVMRSKSRAAAKMRKIY